MPEEEKGFQELLQKFKQEIVVAGYSDKTVETYSCYVKDFLGRTKKPVDEIQRDDLVAYLAYLKQQRKTTNTTLALVHAALKFFFHNFLGKKIVEEIKIPKREKKLPTVLLKQEIKALLKALPSARDRLIVGFLYSTGVRVSEAVGMKTQNLDFAQGTGRVVGGKGKKDRIIILSRKWVSEAKKYLKRRKAKTDYLFSKKNGSPLTTDAVQRMIRIAAKEAGLAKHVTPHVMRHSFGTHLLEAGENIRKIQELLGHSNLSTTQIYTSVSTEELKKVQSPFEDMRKHRTRPLASTNESENLK